MDKKMIFSPSPHVHRRRTTGRAMLHVLLALLPAVACAIYYFGRHAAAVLAVSVAACAATEWLITTQLLKQKSHLADCSALLTGVLLALNLPASLPLWMVAVGAIVAIGIAKMAFGGLGCNIFNPALVGRVFLLISFPVAMTTWPLPGAPDGATGATFLTLAKNGSPEFAYTVGDMLAGNIPGSMGEVSALALIAGGIYLLAMKVIRIWIPLSIIAGLAAVDFIAGFPPGLDIISGGLLLGAIFMATDYVTSPMTTRAMIAYGLAIGIITAVIRRWGAYPEGMSFAILIMNGVTPLLDRYLRPRRLAPKPART